MNESLSQCSEVKDGLLFLVYKGAFHNTIHEIVGYLLFLKFLIRELLTRAALRRWYLIAHDSDSEMHLASVKNTISRYMKMRFTLAKSILSFGWPAKEFLLGAHDLLKTLFRVNAFIAMGYELYSKINNNP